jgi:hypothetical protein
MLGLEGGEGDSGGSGGGGTGSRALGQLLGAFELPLIPGVIIDLWRATSGPSQQPPATSAISVYWATTPIDGVPFAVLERVFVLTETNWGVPSVVQVDLFGRHPLSSVLVLESVTATGD